VCGTVPQKVLRKIGAIGRVVEARGSGGSPREDQNYRFVAIHPILGYDPGIAWRNREDFRPPESWIRIIKGASQGCGAHFK
jgi:hypothetical protein